MLHIFFATKHFKAYKLNMSISTLSKSKMEAFLRFICEKNGIDIEKENNNYSRLINIPLPFDGVKRDGCCALKLNHGLFTQCCEKTVDESEFCKTCQRGEARYGNIDNRISKNEFPYVDPRGKKEIRYGNVMEKLGISKEDALLAARQRGITIKPEAFEVTKSTRGRPKKKITEDVDSSDEEKPKKKRGRPRKEEKMVTHNDTTALVTSLLTDNTKTIENTDPIVSENKSQTMGELVESVEEMGGIEKCDKNGLIDTLHEHLHGDNAKNIPIAWKELDKTSPEKVDESESNVDTGLLEVENSIDHEWNKIKNENNSETKKTAKEAEKAEKKAAKEAEKAAKKAAKEAEKAAKKAAKEAEKAAKKAAKEAEKAAKKAAKKSVTNSNEKNLDNTLSVSNENEIKNEELIEEPMSPYDSGEEEEVSQIVINGNLYLRSDSDVLYDATTQDVVGKYIPGEDGKEGTIVNEDE